MPLPRLFLLFSILTVAFGCAQNAPNPFSSDSDTLAPEVTSVSIESDALTWTSDEASRGVVEYGPEADTLIHYAYEPVREFSTRHSLRLLSLQSFSTYHYRIRLYDQAGNSTSTKAAAFQTESVEAPRVLTLHMLNVGSALCMLVVTPSGKTVLIDSGDSSDIPYVRSYLWSQGVSRLDCAVSTHLHSDHVGGFLGYGYTSLIREFKPVIFLDIPTFTKGYEEQHRDLLAELVASGMDTSSNYFRVSEGTTSSTAEYLDWDPEVNITVLHAGSMGDGNPNNDSMTLKMSFGVVDFLTTGDAEFAAENAMISKFAGQLECEVMQVAHHGNDDATQERYLDNIRPLVALISSSMVEAPLQKDSVLHDIRKRLADYYITDKVFPNTPRSSDPTYGNLVVTTDGYSLEVTLDIQ